MINKELLSKVLDNEVPYQVKVHKIIIKNNSLNYFYNSKDSGGGLFEANEYINIYELAHKCKEWAYKEGFIIDTGFHKYYINQFKANCYGWVSSNVNIKQHFKECTEHESIFKACQWILDNKDKK